MSDNNVYQYSKITSQGTIRLMQLQPSPDLQAPVHCSIVHETLAKYENSLLEFYIAVSYVWSDPNIKSTISVDGERPEITSSLDTALRHIRDSERMLHVWADGVCIDQSEIEDRNLQVSQMGSIYSTAQHTIIFLGHSSPVCDYLWKSMEPMTLGRHFYPSDDGSKSQTPPESPPEELLDSHILNRPWFSRTWVLQELIVSQDPWVQIGMFRIKWLHFSRHILSVPESKWTAGFKRLAQMSEARANIRRLSEGRDPGNPGENLLSLLSSRRGLGVSDARDVVYAHLGMIARSMMIVEKKKSIVVSYAKSVAQVFEDSARLILENAPTLSLLAHVEGEQDERREGLPSWVPDWTRQWNAAAIPLDFGPPKYRDREGTILSFPTPGVLAVTGFERGSVRALLPEPLLPKVCFQGNSGGPTNDDLIDWVESPNTASNAREALRIFIDYHVELTRSLNKEGRSIAEKWKYWQKHISFYTPATLKSILQPMIIMWSKEFSPGALGKIEREGEPGSIYLIDFLTIEFVRNIIKVLGNFIPGSGSIALLDSNYTVQVPIEVHINDCVGQFRRESSLWASFIFRPQPGKQDPDWDPAVREEFSPVLNVKHFKYVVPCGSFHSGFELFDIDNSSRTIFAIH